MRHTCIFYLPFPFDVILRGEKKKTEICRETKEKDDILFEETLSSLLQDANEIINN